MNERIKQLWEKSTGATVPAEGFYSSASNYNIEKFAELIVKECADVAQLNTPDTEECEYTHLVSEKIREHFGVE